MDLGLAGAKAVVQGGSRGMGRAAAECLARDGARVAVLARERKALDETVEALRKAGSPDAVGLSVDLRDRTQVDAAFAELGQRWGELNILINAAGPTAGIGGIEDVPDEGWYAAFDEGALSMVRCVRAALPWLRKAEWARIVNVSAHSTKRQTAGLVAYTASKSAMTSISKNLSLALAEDGILVNTVSPGSFASPALRGWAKAHGYGEDLHGIMRGIKEVYGHPSHLPRAGDPSEIGPVIAFLASRVNSYMTGANVNVDGGSDFA
jgi:NAD(P)-dependent dehydrogenase (short-subunit alcohol dehydrogenase family)